ncbi:CRISPR-associated helicase Cas3' [Rhodobacteraceae bacterium RKSG542]|uniref:CRISPR-associated helicase Cas3' n=1 Tax=Pseudovibrio flavus TaxID=2529854 RepID=UPI0012BBE9A3|nr:CRISPR-associated helicase Cas3' [Pseudovibrio flavus]MTI15921.1 CRISPR-associated helicase Cas3' [Pseudovibrio flavus]
MMIFAHSVEGAPEEDWEPLSIHLQNVVDAASRNATVFGAGNLGAIAGYLHDLGKLKPAFQAKLRGAKNDEGHSGEGARFAVEHLPPIAKLLAYGIAGHHAGLANGLEPSEFKPHTPLTERIKAAEKLELPVWLSLPNVELPPCFTNLEAEQFPFAAQFFTRMLFSALVDADFIETERFYSPQIERQWTGKLADLRVTLDQRLADFEPPAADDTVNQARAKVLQSAKEKAKECPGFFSLTVPTGGGKTLSSLKFAMDHAVQHKLRRVIYVAPFTSIIEQTADVFREALGDEDAILEHHSSFEFDEIADENKAEKLKLAAQNWDRPVVVTTAVQLFESLYANRPAKCRKLHNLAGSVIVLDEAQSLPIHLLRPCLAALKELVRGYGCSVVLCTATQPALYSEQGFLAPEALSIASTREIAPNPAQLFTQLKRVEVRNIGAMTNEQLVDALRGRCALVIVNSKKQARALFDHLKGEGVFHLSTNMTARHRRAVLEEIRLRLKGGKRTLVISTALVEAGVDLDFPEVWRALAGVDSIAQAAGRCNREGKLERGILHVFEPEDTFTPPPEIALNAQKAQDVLKNYSDPLTPEAIEAYFRELYWSRNQDMDSHHILDKISRCGSELNFNFADMAAHMRLIQDYTVPLIIGGGPYGLGEDARSQLFHSPHAGSIARLMQRYSVQVSPRVRSKLIASGDAIVARTQDFGDQFVVLENVYLYDEEAGFCDAESGDVGSLFFEL